MTEGDAIHAVFQSASSAVLCGLEIVEAAAEPNAGLGVGRSGSGVGVHAGEAVETAEGYIGRAVNIAARLCAAAQPGEVLVELDGEGHHAGEHHGRVRASRTAASEGDRGPDPCVRRDPRREREGPALGSTVRHRPGGVAGPAVALSIVTAFAGSRLVGVPAASVPAASLLAKAGPTTPQVVMGPLSIGTYTTSEFRPSVSFDIADQGWIANRDGPDMFGLIRDSAPRGSVQFLRVREVVPNACIAGGDGASAGPVPIDPLAVLEGLEHLTRDKIRNRQRWASIRATKSMSPSRRRRSLHVVVW